MEKHVKAAHAVLREFFGPKPGQTANTLTAEVCKLPPGERIRLADAIRNPLVRVLY